MSEPLAVAGAVATAIVTSVIILTLFFRGLAWLSGEGAKTDTLAVRGVLKKNTLASVHVDGGNIFERVRFIGFTNSAGAKTYLPFELSGMVILEDEQKLRYLIRAKNIRMIVVEPEADSSTSA